MLEIRGLIAGYGSIEALHGISLAVAKGRAVALLGGNGAGKTTTLKSIMGLIPVRGGEVSLSGERLDRLPSHQIYRRGIALVPQGRELFPEMSVTENLEMGALLAPTRRETPRLIEEIFAYFPRLKERARQRAGTLSGGEQQMLATGRAMMSRPALLLLDEPSAGLAPLVVAELARIIRQLNQAGQTILIVEQNVRMALRVADHVYVIRNGEIVLDQPAGAVADDDAMFKSYLG